MTDETTQYDVPEQGDLKAALRTVLPLMQAREKIQQDALITDVDGATITFNIDNSNIHTVTLAGNRTLALRGGKLGQVFTIRLVQDGTGSRTVTWFTTVNWAGGSAPTLTTTGGKADTFIFLVTAINSQNLAITCDGYVVGQNV